MKRQRLMFILASLLVCSAAVAFIPIGCRRKKESTRASVYTQWPFDAAEARRRQQETGKALGVPVQETIDLGNGVTLKLALMPAGKFIMGSPKDEDGHAEDEGPPHEVTISKPLYMGACEVTQAQWKAVMASVPWRGETNAEEGEDQPASYVDWADAVSFCGKLSAKIGKTVRLPTEAEWEYACRAGSKTRFSFGDREGDLKDHAWYVKNSDGKTHAVGQKEPNAWGLYDMHGNVWEWCADWYGEVTYVPGASAVDPKGPESGEYRVLRGGSWCNYPAFCRSAYRNRGLPGHRDSNHGFRVVVEVGCRAG